MMPLIVNVLISRVRSDRPCSADVIGNVDGLRALTGVGYEGWGLQSTA